MKTSERSKRCMTLVIVQCCAAIQLLISISSCSVSKPISNEADSMLLKDTAIGTGHIGISIYEPATGKYWYNYDAEKYFIPASNTKLFTLYAGMKYLGDSLVGMRYITQNDTVYALPAADPSFLHPDFMQQPVADFLLAGKLPVKFCNSQWKAEKFGMGWAWDDYNDEDMVERSPLPVYGNIMKIGFSSSKIANSVNAADSITIRTLDLYYPKRISFTRSFNINDTLRGPALSRRYSTNDLDISFPDKVFAIQRKIPFVTNGIRTSLQILHAAYARVDTVSAAYKIPPVACTVIHSQPSDSLFKPMMHRSDNFFAEQTLLMVSNERLGYMSDKAIIDSLLKTDLKDLPQQPKWVDGCGLSRYNLFTPQSFIYILNKMRNEFGWERLKNILATGGEGTLKNYYKKDSGYIYAKTGTLSNNCALSGFLTTNKGKFLIFSILSNNYITGATPVRQATERFLEAIREKY